VVERNIGRRVLDRSKRGTCVMPKDRIIAPFFGLGRPGNDLELTPDEFSQRDSQPPRMGFRAGPQILGKKNGGAMHSHIYTLYGYGCQSSVIAESIVIETFPG